MKMQTMSSVGLEVTYYCEAKYLAAYPDPASPLGKECHRLHLKPSRYKAIPSWQNLSGAPWTIGVGAIHLLDGTPVKEGDTITDFQCSELLASQMESVSCFYVRKLALTAQCGHQNQFDALADFTYNRGSGRLNSLLHMPGDIADNLLHFDYVEHADGSREVLLGLQRRRRMNRAMYLGLPWGAFKTWVPK